MQKRFLCEGARFVTLGAAFLLLLNLAACSIHYALSHPAKGVNFVPDIGMPRDAVISQLGQPDETATDNDGKKVDRFVVNDMSSNWGKARPLLFGVLDIFSLGIFEGTYAMSWDQCRTYDVTYDESNNVKKVEKVVYKLPIGFTTPYNPLASKYATKPSPEPTVEEEK